MSVERPQPPERRRRRQEPPEAQLSFLAPEDAAMVHMLRRFLAEAARIYESQTGQGLAEALTIRSPKDAYEFLRLEMEGLEQEQLRVINLDARNRVISARLIYQGSLNCSHVRVGEIFRPALIDNAAAIILAHNHPSSDVSASPDDLNVTHDVVKAGRLLGVDVLDRAP
jgi:DNA repair protein RadC